MSKLLPPTMSVKVSRIGGITNKIKSEYVFSVDDFPKLHAITNDDTISDDEKEKRLKELAIARVKDEQ